MAERLTAAERAHVIHELLVIPHHGSRRTGWVLSDDVLTVNFERFLKATSERMSELQRARDLVVEDPEILGGTPVVRGTRVPVYDIAASLEAGRSAEELRATYPSLTIEAVELARVYALANPRRGRPNRPERLHMRVSAEGRRPRRSST